MDTRELREYMSSSQIRELLRERILDEREKLEKESNSNSQEVNLKQDERYTN